MSTALRITHNSIMILRLAMAEQQIETESQKTKDHLFDRRWPVSR
jgi:hypothetical protein